MLRSAAAGVRHENVTLRERSGADAIPRRSAEIPGGSRVRVPAVTTDHGRVGRACDREAESVAGLLVVRPHLFASLPVRARSKV